MLPDTPLRFEFLLFDGFSNMVLASTLEPLRDVKTRTNGAGITWSTSTMTGVPVTSSSGLVLVPDHPFDADAQGRTLVLVAGYHMRDALTPAQLAQIRSAARHADQVIAVDTAPWLLAAAGLLDGHAATIHWQEMEAFREQFPRVSVSSARFVRSGRFLTCGGASTALDMILDYIQTSFGPAAAFEASNMFIYDPARQKELGRGPKRLRDKASPKLLAALDVMAGHVEQPLTTAELAARVNLSDRTLNRLFQNELGMTPGTYYRLFRLQTARHLAEETTLSQEQIALRCGFSSGVSLARAFGAAFGTSIKALRQR